jgi:hypothetical protein
MRFSLTLLEATDFGWVCVRAEQAAEKVSFRGEKVPSAAKAEFIAKQLRTA